MGVSIPAVFVGSSKAGGVKSLTEDVRLFFFFVMNMIARIIKTPLCFYGILFVEKGGMYKWNIK